jgi:hypothetical protein
MDDEYSMVKPESVDLAYEILNQFQGADAAVVFPALVVIVTELIAQTCTDRAEANVVALGIFESVAESLKHCEDLGPLSN